MPEQFNADLYISLSANKEGNIKPGGKSILAVRCGNAGPDSIVEGCLDVTISVGPNVKILRISKTGKDDDGQPSAYNDWEMKLDKRGLGNTAKLSNKRSFGAFDISILCIEVEASKRKGTSKLVGGHVSYLHGKDANGKWYVQQGNADPTNDNSSTSFTVI